MKYVDACEHHFRIEWLKKNRTKLCPDCTGEPFEKKEWDFTRFCNGCKLIWKTIKDRWEYEV